MSTPTPMEIILGLVPGAEQQPGTTVSSKTSRRIGRTFSELSSMVRLLGLVRLDSWDRGDVGGYLSNQSLWVSANRTQKLPYRGCALDACMCIAAGRICTPLSGIIQRCIFRMISSGSCRRRTRQVGSSGHGHVMCSIFSTLGWRYSTL